MNVEFIQRLIGLLYGVVVVLCAVSVGTLLVHHEMG